MLELIPSVVAYLAVLAIIGALAVRFVGRRAKTGLGGDPVQLIRFRSRLRISGLTLTLVEVNGRDYLVAQDSKGIALSPVEAPVPSSSP